MPSRPRIRSLHTLLLLLVLAAVVPVGVLALFTHLHQRDQARQRVGEETARLVRLAALRHRDLLDGGRELLTTIVQLPSVRSFSGSECAEQLGGLLALHRRFANLGVADGDGALRCSALPTDKTPGFSDRLWFQRAMATARFAVGDYVIGRITGRPSVVFGYPITADDGGRPAGAAFAALDLVWLEEFAASARLPDDGVLTVVDGEGRVLARHPDVGGLVGRPLPPGELADSLARHRDGLATDPDGGDGVPRIYAHAPLLADQPGTPHVAVGLPISAAYSQADRALWRNLMLLGIIGAGGVAVAWTAGNRLVARPARRTVAAAARLAAGDQTARAGPPYGSGELADVARAFDGMAGVLVERESELRRSREQLQSILDNAPASIFMRDLDGRYVLVNRRFEDLTGVDRRTAVGRHLDEVFPPEVAARLADHDAEALSRGEPVEHKEELPGADGPRVFRSQRFVLHNAAGTPYAVCGIATDITEQLRTHAEREGLKAQLQQAQRLESLGQLAGGIAHDFNNLLAVIINYADFVLGELPSEAGQRIDGDAIRDDVALILSAAERAAALTRQLLIFARRDQAEPAILDLNAVIVALEPLLTRTLGEDVTLRFDLADELQLIRADASRLEQVLINLAVNARDAMVGGGVLTVRTENRALDEERARAMGLPGGGNYVHLAVSDTGTGMPTEVASRAFDPFFTTKPKGQGTGLGLATVFGIVTEAGGVLGIDSTVGVGTTVLVHFPATGESATAADTGNAEAAGVVAPRGRGETVLVVEDEDPVREVARRILAEAGYEVLVASEAEEALAVCAEHAGGIDLLVSDVIMPGLPGPELARRAVDLHPGLRAVFLSGYPEDFLARRGAGEDVIVIGKPFTAETLLRHVRRALDTPGAGRPLPR